MTLMIPIFLVKNGIKLYEDISLCGVSLERWIGTELGIPLTYLAYPIREAAHTALDMLMRSSAQGKLSPEARYIDITSAAKRKDSGKTGSVKIIK